MGNMYTPLYGLVLEGIMAELELEEDEAGYLANFGVFPSALFIPLITNVE